MVVLVALKKVLAESLLNSLFDKTKC
jgi:hypothetical protein